MPADAVEHVARRIDGIYANRVMLWQRQASSPSNASVAPAAPGPSLAHQILAARWDPELPARRAKEVAVDLDQPLCDTLAPQAAASSTTRRVAWRARDARGRAA